MGDVIQFRAKRLTGFISDHEPAPVMSTVENDEGEVLYCSPPVKDTAPSEYSAPPDDCA